MGGRVGLAVVAVLFMAASPTANAHSTALVTAPLDGSDLAAPPPAVWIHLDHSPDGTFSLRAADWQGDSILAGPARAVGDRIEAPVDPDTPPGAYFVAWSTRNGVDGHESTGAWAFTIGGASLPTNPPAWHQEPSTDVTSIIGYFFLYAGLTLTVGSVVMQLGVVRPGLVRLEAKRLVGAGLIGGATLVVGLVILALQYRLASGSLTGTFYGKVLLLRLGAASLLTGLFAWHRLDRRDADGRLQAALVAINIVLLGWYGHAAAFAPERWIGATVDALHQGAVFVWIGGVAVLFILYGTRWLHLMEGRDANVQGEMAIATRQFSRLAGASVALVGLTGIGLMALVYGEATLRPWSLRDAGDHGRLLTAKMGLFAFMAILGAWSHWRYTPRLANGRLAARFRRHLGRELAVGTLILLLVSLLVHLDPTRA